VSHKRNKPDIEPVSLQNEAQFAGSKTKQVKGFMPLSRHKADKHRPAKPFGDCGMI